MSIKSKQELLGIQQIAEAVGTTLRKMIEFAAPGMSTLELDLYGGELLDEFGAKSAPKITYGFPGYTCISVNHEIAHGIPSASKVLKEGDLVNIDVSGELDGFWADNGGSFVLGNSDPNQHQALVEASETILNRAIGRIRGGLKIAELGKFIEDEARKKGYKVLKNLVGHGIGRSLHEAPVEIPCFYDRSNTGRFRKNDVVAVETFISTSTRMAKESGDGWTLVTGDSGFVAQHEHTILITDNKPVVLTAANGFL
jgi:methionyl aminopeptidase